MSVNVRVLIIDDEPTVRAAIELAAEENDWTIEAVESAEEALTRLRSAHFDMLLVDKNLPGMNGVELIRNVRGSHRDVGIVMITGYASVESASETLHLGIDGYIEKPFDNVYDVIERIEKIVENRKERRQSGSLSTAFEHFRRAIDSLKGISSQKREVGILSVLVVSPHTDDHAWYENQFQLDAQVTSLSSPAQGAIESLKKQPNVIILDASIHDPGLVDFLREIRPSNPDAGVIVVSERQLSLDQLTHLIDLDVSIVMYKPLNQDVFQQKVAEATNRIKRALDSDQ